jgi:hypothetical protein
MKDHASLRGTLNSSSRVDQARITLLALNLNVPDQFGLTRPGPRASSSVSLHFLILLSEYVEGAGVSSISQSNTALYPRTFPSLQSIELIFDNTLLGLFFIPMH